MLLDHLHQLVKTLPAVEYLTLSVLDIFLQIKCCGFRNTKILHCIRNLNSHILTNSEEMVNSITARENDGSMLEDVNPLFPEILSFYTFNLNELVKINLQIVFF